MKRFSSGSHVGVALLAGSFLCAAAAAQIADPLPDPVTPSGLRVRVLDWVQIPDSGIPPSPARLSMALHAGDGSGRLFVNDLRGKLYVVAAATVSLYLDLAADFPFFVDTPGLGTGFQSFAFAPSFTADGRFYTVHSESPDAGVPDLVSPTTTSPAQHSVLTEWIADVPLAATFSGISREVLRIEQPGTIHSLQLIAFNPNAASGAPDYGLLYLAQGDGGELFTSNPQGLDSPHGAMLRIDPLGNNSDNGRYGIPADNPFAGDGDQATVDEIWAWGFRNPHRFSWDRGGDGKMLIGDIGQANIEEINMGVHGGNYGWNDREGTFVFDPAQDEAVFALPADDELFGYRYPVAQYDHDEGAAIVGGFVYRGAQIPELAGEYVFGDIVNGRVFHVPVDALVEGAQATVFELSFEDGDGVPVTLEEITPGNRVDLRFGLDESGELYVLSKADGRVRRLAPVPPVDSDGDGEPDVSDNCTFVGNPDQRDTNGDGIGNICDADLNDDCVVNFSDLAAMKDAFFSVPGDVRWNADADLGGDGAVGFLDLGGLKAAFFSDFLAAPPSLVALDCVPARTSGSR